MDIEQRVIKALEKLNLIDAEIKIHDSRSRIEASVVSPSFEGMEDADRQSMIWGQSIDELGDYDSGRVGYVHTATPEEVAEMIAETNSGSPRI